MAAVCCASTSRRAMLERILLIGVRRVPSASNVRAAVAGALLGVGTVSGFAAGFSATGVGEIVGVFSAGAGVDFFDSRCF